jgi:hypothetical protein
MPTTFESSSLGDDCALVSIRSSSPVERFSSACGNSFRSLVLDALFAFLQAQHSALLPSRESGAWRNDFSERLRLS